MNERKIIDMNKTELIKKISQETTLSQKDVANVLDTFQKVVKETVEDGDDVKMTGFLTFSKKHVDAKTGVIQLGDKKGQAWETPAKDEVSVKLSKSYKAI